MKIKITFEIMAYYGKDLRRTIVSFHVIFSALWLGAALSMIILMFTKNPQNASELLAYSHANKLIDDWIIIGSATGSFLTGLSLSWKTPWGFFKHWWVIVKLLLTITLILLGTFWLGKWTNESVYMVHDQGLNVYSNKEYLDFQASTRFWGSLQFCILIFIFFLSVFKPWKKIQKSSKKQEL
ncbi:DUF2269 family protein [Maribellus maritimus]|uniref:DUF2269 family protein n=1 Tax=Maribellus maritimus TaxID=2870838 RepID=UPI001EEB4D95|nr:DUF2269 family protein [Maribellus maritimus]MCG6191151.1 DUF2269 family protein [Maribellus maritimus]